MEDARAIFGKTVSLTGKGAACYVAMGVGEAFFSSGDELPPAIMNMFGRIAERSPASDLQTLTGISSTGLRAAAYLTNREFLNNLSGLRDLINNHFPAIIYLANASGPIHGEDLQAGYQAASQLGCFQLYASNLQELVDLALIAHKVSELALVPGVIGWDPELTAEPGQFAHFPESAKVREFLGSPDDLITSPTPAQRLIFGEKRRRIPAWFSVDLPVLLGNKKDNLSRSLEWAAQNEFFSSHLGELLASARKEFEIHTGRKYDPLLSYKTDDADFIAIVQGHSFWSLIKAVDHLRSTKKAKVGVASLSQLRPFPTNDIAKLITNKNGITILDTGLSTQDSGFLYREVKSLASHSARPSQFYQGFYGTILKEGDAISVFENMLGRDQKKSRFYTGVSFVSSDAEHPQQEVLLQGVIRQYPGIEDLALESSTSSQKTTGGDLEASREPKPMMEKILDQGPAYSRLSRFFRDTVYFHQFQKTNRLAADPFQSLPVTPAMTQGFAAPNDKRTQLPVFKPELCSGCGKCQIYCPHIAIPSTAASIEELLRGIQQIAGRRGKPASKLTPYIKKLAQLGEEVLRTEGSEVFSLAELLPRTFDRLVGQAGLKEERLAEVRADFDLLLEVGGGFTFATPESFFQRAELIVNPSSILFALAVDPAACSGCGVCEEICPEEALVMSEITDDLLDASDRQFELLVDLAPTSPDFIRKKINDPQHDSLSAIMLDFNNYYSMIHGRSDETGASTSVILHAITSMIHFLSQSNVEGMREKISGLSSQLAERIHSEMSSAIPRGDSEILRTLLDKSSGERLPLDEVIGRLGKSEHLSLVDTSSLKRKMELLDDLKHLLRLYEKGPTGLGRSDHGLLIDQGVNEQWPLIYPWNPFHSPVMVSESASYDHLNWLMKGTLRHFTDNMKLIRRAELEVSGKYRPDLHAKEIADLGWDQLTEKEKALAPRLIFVLRPDRAAGLPLQGMPAILHSDVPVKILILDDEVPDTDDDPFSHFFRTWPLTASLLAGQNNHYLQMPLDLSGKTFDRLSQVFNSPKPAILSCLTPQTPASDQTSWPTLFDLAIRTRAFPFLHFAPDEKRFLLSSGLDLSPNPDPDKRWSTEIIQYVSGEVSQEMEYTYTYADWLFHQKHWSENFQPADENQGDLLVVADFLSLDSKKQSEKIPVIYSVDGQKQKRAWIVPEKAIEMTKTCLKKWNLLRELAGYLTDQPEKLWKKAEEELRQKFEKDSEDLKRDFERREKDFERRLMEKVKNKLRDKLIMISEKGRIK